MQVLILAGGGGTRLWPLSRKKYPKQFLKLTGEYSLIQNTALRVKEHNIWVITNEDTAFITEDQISRVIPFFSQANVIVEPVGRNTAPAIAYAASFFNKNEILAVLPADHHIEKEEEFKELLKQAEELAREGYIVTFGVVPQRPETGYGYIQVTSQKKRNAYIVNSFKEKPNVETAKQYIQSGNYFWNSGMFVFSVKTLWEELRKHNREIIQVVEKIGGQKASEEDYLQFPEISIDYAVMEKTDRLVLLPADIGWSDIGGFEALWENLEKDEEGNAIQGELDFRASASSNNLFFAAGSQKKIISAIGIKDLVIVDTDDAILISSRRNSQNVKQIFQEIEKEGKEVAFFHTMVHRPWGYYRNIWEGEGYKVKEIMVYPGQRLSLQSHNRRSESWTVVEGEGMVVNGEKEVIMQAGQNIFIPKQAKHRLTNTSSDKILKIIEVQMGDYFGEDDIIRYEDDYNRVT